MKILVVEDNTGIKEILDYILKDDGHEVISCPDGSSLAELERTKPDLILMDDMLEGTRGSELCLQLKQDYNTQNIPVILTSARAGLKETAEKCKADNYLEKPFDIDQLIRIIRPFASEQA